MDVEHKARITELEVKTPGMPPVEKEARAQALKGYAGIVEARIEEVQKLINDASEAWKNMEDIDGLVQVWEKLQATPHEVDSLTGTMKDLQPIQRMLKMGETTKLQAKMHKLREKEARYTKTLQPWQTRLSTIALKVTENLSQAQQMQIAVTSLMEEQSTADLVDATRESVDHITKEIVELNTNFTKLNNDIWDATHSSKAQVEGLGMNHK